MTFSSLAGHCGKRSDAAPVLLAIVIAHQTHIAAARAATVADTRRARAAARASDALARAILELERLQLPDRTAHAAERSTGTPLAVPDTVTPLERAWVLAWHLLAAIARIHNHASTAGHPTFGERETATALESTRGALRELEPLLTPGRRAELRAALTSAALSLEAQLRLFGALIPTPLHGPPSGEAALGRSL